MGHDVRRRIGSSAATHAVTGPKRYPNRRSGRTRRGPHRSGKVALPADLVLDEAGAVGWSRHKLIKGYWETSAAKVWPPPEAFSQARPIATGASPEAGFQRRILWRYSLAWTKSATGP